MNFRTVMRRTVVVGSAAPPARGNRLLQIAVAIGGLIGLLAGLGWATTGAADYQATGTAFVALTSPTDERDPFSASQFVTQRIGSYAQLGTAPEVLAAVAADVGGRSVAELTANVTVTAVPGTVLLRVVAHDRDSATATTITNSVMSHLDETVARVEAAGPEAAAPIQLVPVQPAIAGQTSSMLDDAVKVLSALIIGTALGAAVGWTARRFRRR